MGQTEDKMMDRLEILASRLRRGLSRTRWVAQLLGHRPPAEGAHREAGLLLIQVDGLGMDVLREALAADRMPFLADLLVREHYSLHDLYTGLPSSTPAVQAELFYGHRCAVPAFGYRDAELDRVVSTNDPTVARTLEARFAVHANGLLRGGSNWSNMFAGEADEPHICAATADVDMLWKALNPLRTLGLLFWYFWSVVRMLGHLVIETSAACMDVLRRGHHRNELGAELRFVPTRVLVSAVIREIITAGASVDLERGLPVVQLNYLGYDEHAHRRGPKSPFALWTLRGIDACIRRVWLAAHRSSARDYQVWIYSDHGQETVVPYPIRYGRSVGDAVREVITHKKATVTQSPRTPVASGSERARWFTRDLPRWAQRSVHPEARVTRPDDFLRQAVSEEQSEEFGTIDIVHQGPVGMVYLERPFSQKHRHEVARALCDRAKIPLVLLAEDAGRATAYTHHGQCLRLPEQSPELFGNTHPFLREITEDILRVVHHDEAGNFVLMGYDKEEPFSLQHEHGSHGGPGRLETHAFVVFSPEVEAVAPVRGTLRPDALRERAREAMAGSLPPRAAVWRAARSRDSERTSIPLRLISYNVHGCRGMDGKYSAQRIARVLAREQPDIVCLQELDHGRARSANLRQIEEISAALSTDYDFHAVSEVDDGEFGNAILSHHPMRRLGHAALPRISSLARLEPRGVLRVEVQIDGTPLEVVVTHLSILERERRKQVKALLDGGWLEATTGESRPLILCGDFNASPRSYTCRRIGEHLDNIDLRWPDARRLKTWSSRIAMRRIDHVFVNRNVDVEQVRIPRTQLTQVASDHLPLITDLRVSAISSESS
jgi:endonuclease/exonuclease/phosphatase family metal-dependent hydrolase